MAHHAKPVRLLTLTGERKNRRFLVKLGKKRIWLSASLYSALSQLALGRRYTPPGFCMLPRLTVHRLRSAVRGAVGRRVASDLIETGADSEYRLRIDPAHLRVEPSCRELRGKHLLDPDEMAALARWLDEMKPV